MAGKRIVHVNRDLILTSDKFIGLSVAEWGAYYVSLCNLAKTEESNPLRGCLCCGADPMTVDQWRVECGFHRVSDAEKVWAELFRRGLFEWHSEDGKHYARVARFGSNQDRLKRKFRRDRAEIKQTSRRDHADFKQVSRGDSKESQQVTTQNSGKSPQDTLTTLTYPSTNVDETNVTVGSDKAERLAKLREQNLPPDVLAKLERTILKDERERRDTQTAKAELEQRVSAAMARVKQAAEEKQAFNVGLAEQHNICGHVVKLTHDLKSEAFYKQAIREFCRTEQGYETLCVCIGDLEDRTGCKDPLSVPLENPGRWFTGVLKKEADRIGIAITSEQRERMRAAEVGA